MLVYHGTIKKLEKPSVKYSMRHLDFGIGFYVTKIKSQAKRWAKRKSVIENKKDFYVNIYELDKKYTECKYLLFDKANEEWLDFVCACRDGKLIGSCIFFM